jgi:DNA-binding transcriptional LysR family regulator
VLIRHLSYFIALAREQHFARAAVPEHAAVSFVVGSEIL